MKTCSQCLKRYSLTFYYVDRSKPDGHRPNCKTCEGKRNRKDHLKRKYNLTEQDIDKLKAIQYNKCKICEENKKLVVDHCHSTGKVRGLLCHGCNAAIGFFKEDMGRLLRAGAYLVRYKKTCKEGDYEVFRFI